MEKIKHGNRWRGGRTVSSHGYMLIRMPNHPRVNKNGYIYEHTLVAEKILGRPLKKGEIVHHIDENRQNNSEENIAIKKSIAYHKVEHRNNNSKLRSPGEDNPLIECLCGCGALFRKYDLSGRPRQFISGGHSKRKLTNLKIIEIIELLEKGYSKVKVAEMLGINRKSIYKAKELNNAIKQGKS